MPELHPTEVSLFGRLRRGDTRALEGLLDAHGPALRAYLQRRIPAAIQRRVSISDVLQETRVTAAAKLDAFAPESEGAWRAFLFAIADRKVRDVLRRHGATAKRAVGREVTRGPDGPVPQAFAGAPSQSQVAIGHEARDRAERAMASLPADYRWVLHLARGLDLPLSEVAELMGRSREAVKKLYGRALCRLKAAYEGQEAQGGA